MSSSSTRIGEIVDGIYRISTWQAPYGTTFNQFLIADERPALIHTGMHHLYESVRKAIGQVLDPAKLSAIVLLHWEGDENGGMERFMSAAPESDLVGSASAVYSRRFTFVHRAASSLPSPAETAPLPHTLPLPAAAYS